MTTGAGIKDIEIWKFYSIIQSKKSAVDVAFDALNVKMNKGEQIPRDELAAFLLILDDFRNQFFFLDAVNGFSGVKFPTVPQCWKSVKGISQKLERGGK